MPRTLKKQSRKALKTKEKTRTLKFSRQSDDEYLQEEKTGSLSGIMKMNRLNISLIAAALLAAACQADDDSDLRSEGHVITARLGSDNALNLTGPLSSRLGLASFSIQVICDGYDTNIINVEQYDIANDIWIRMAPIPSPRFRFGAAASGETVGLETYLLILSVVFLCHRYQKWMGNDR